MLKSERNKDLLPVLNGDRVDLIALMKNIWLGRRIVLITFGLFVVLGVLIAMLSPVKYRAGAVLLPQVEDQRDLGQLGGLASLAGVDLAGMMGNSSGIAPELYPNIVSSYPFLNELVHTEFAFSGSDEGKTLFKHLEENQKANVLLKYTLRLPWTLKEMLFPLKETELSASAERDGRMIAVTRDELDIFETVGSHLSVEVSTKTGLVSVAFSWEDPYVAAQVAQKVVDLLQEYVIDYKTSQVRNSLDFVEARFEEKKKEFELAQERLFAYQDAHRNRVSERISARFQELSDEYNLTRAIYQNLAQQVEQTRLTVKKETPAFSVLEPVKIPVEKSEPRRSVIVVGFGLLGFVLGLLFWYALLLFHKIRAAWNRVED